MPLQKRWGKKREDKRDWKSYNKKLVKRGEFFINPRFLDTWLVETEEMNRGKVGQPYLYPPSLIEFLAILKSKGFDYRTLEGILRGLSMRLGPFPVISFSQIRRRIISFPIGFTPNGEDFIVGGDGSGLKVSNRGEWIMQVWKIRRGWVEVIILGDIHGNVIDIRVGNENSDERGAVQGMLRKNKKNIKKALLDGHHDCKDTFKLCNQLDIEPGIKIRKDANNKGVGLRPREVRSYQEQGYKEWAKRQGYGYRWPATEGIFSAVKRIFGECVQSHKKRNMYKESKLKFWSYQQLKSIE